MENKVYKIGEEIIVKEDFELETVMGIKILVKKDDKAVINSRGFIQYTTGNARYMNQLFKGLEVKGYDYTSIARMVLNRLNVVFSIENFLDDVDITSKEVLEEIKDVLMDIL